MSIRLVTGATGFVGSALVARLLRDGANVRVLARDVRSAQQLRERDSSPQLDVRIASLGDPNAIADAADGVDVVYHTAAENSADVPQRSLAWINVAGTENVLNASRHAGVRRLVHVSCADVTLVNRDRLNWKETRQLDELPLDAVCHTKQLAEEVVLAGSTGSLEVVALRPAWVWGPGDRRTIPALCREGARGRVSLCGSGENLLPTTYIGNLVDALLLAATTSGVGGNAYHVVDGETLNAREFLGQLCAALGLPAPSRGLYGLAYVAAWIRERTGLAGMKRADVARRGRSSLFDTVAATRELGYEPKITVDQGMLEVAEWAKQVGGPSAIAATERKPSTATDVDDLIRIADTATGEAVSSAPSASVRHE
ncbi:MAG TPA: NAD-dependent epimerase/dehydratase family protein [Polyangiales bacterium]|nr:NAD-dependent epimerase/dehydratase family protein [Polyangiales bacterium]